MQQQFNFQGKEFTLTLSHAAKQALAKRTVPLVAEMELYFSCLIRLKVHFYENQHLEGSVPVDDHLRIRFRPVMTQHCDNNYKNEAPPVTDFPIVKPEAFVPRWLELDYRGGEWHGEFGYTATHASH